MASTAKLFLRDAATALGHPLVAESVANVDIGGGTYGKSGSTGNGSSQTSLASASLSPGQKEMFAQFALAELSAQTIGAGTWTITVGAMQGIAVRGVMNGVLYVWRPSTSSVVGLIADPNLSTASFNPSSDVEVSLVMTVAGSSLAVLAGDILILEVWALGNALLSAVTIFYDGDTEGSATSNAAKVEPPAPILIPDPPPPPPPVFLDAPALGALQRSAFQEDPVDQRPVGFQVDKGGVPQAFQPEAFQRNGAFQEIWTLAPTAIPTAESLGTARLVRIAKPTGIASGETVGSARVVRLLGATGISTSEVLGTARIERVVRATGIVSAEAVGISRAVRVLKATGIPSAESFGSATIVVTKLLVAQGITTGEAFGSARLVRIAKPNAIPTEETVGSAQAVRVLGASSISTGEQFGDATLLYTRFLTATAIPSAEAFGTATLVNGGVQPTASPPGGHGQTSPFGRGRGWSPPSPRTRVADRSAESADRSANEAPPPMRLLARCIGSSEGFGTSTVTFGRNPRHIADEEALLVLI